jgi:hypothetical protein
MKIALPTLQGLLKQNVLEIKFSRRRPKPNTPPTRRMLCTNARQVLSTIPGRESLHFRETYKTPSFNPSTKNLLIAWDIFKQDYRMVNCDNVSVISQIPANEEFWTYFNTVLYKMSAGEKETFFNL